MERSYSKDSEMNRLYTPLVLSVIYILGTFIASIFMPVIYTGAPYRYVPVFFFLIGVCGLFTTGYLFGIHVKQEKPVYPVAEDREHKMMGFMLAMSIASLAIELAFLVHIRHFSLNINDIGIMYITPVEASSSLVYVLRFLCAPFRFGAICIGLFKFFRIPAGLKAAVVINIVFYLCVFLFGYGVQKGFADIAVLLLLSVAVYALKKRDGRLNILIFIIVSATALLFFFSYVQFARFDAIGKDLYNYRSSNFYFDPDNAFFDIFGEKLGFGLAMFINGYLAQGYYGLSLCMQMPFKWTYGVGSCYALTRFFEHFGVNGIFERTYIFRLEDAFDRNGLRSWNTVFPWLASDYTWIGTTLFFALVGFIMARSWREVTIHDNMLSYSIFSLSVILVLFIPANNQLFHGYDNFLTTWFFLIIWVFGKWRYMHE